MGILQKSLVNKSHFPWIVWGIRILIGAVFVFSGFVKSIDLWGFVYKIEEYLSVWHTFQPRSIVFSVALLISGFEFVSGIMLMCGCYRKSIPILMLAMMCFMLPLTGYIWLKNPVADCGCFGDFLIISNGLTFLKNILITAGLVFLLFYNKQIRGVYGPYIQWFTLFLSVIYIMFIGIVGYYVQPMLDFRSFPVNSGLLDEKGDSDEIVEFRYEKNGEEKIFDSNNLPDSTWNYVERITKTQENKDKTEFYILEDGENITGEVIDTASKQLLVLIPEYERADASYSYLINEMDSYIGAHGGSLVALLGGTRENIDEWVDLSMAEYPIYLAEPTLLKELARGTISIVYLENGIIKWKRNASSIDVEMFENPKEEGIIDKFYFDGKKYLINYTLLYLCIMCVIFFLDRSGSILKWKRNLKKNQVKATKQE